MTTKKPKPAAKRTAPKKPAKRPPKAKTTKPKAAGPKRKVGRPKRFATPKANLPDLADPTRQVADWIVAGIPDTAIDEAVIAVLKCSRQEAAAVRQLAYAYLAELIAADPATRKTWHMAARLELYRRTLQIHDYKTARDILRDLAQLEGLYPKITAKAAAAGQAAADGLDIPTAADFPTVQ